MSNLMTLPMQYFLLSYKGSCRFRVFQDPLKVLYGLTEHSLEESLSSRSYSPWNQNPYTIQPNNPTASPVTSIWQVSLSQLENLEGLQIGSRYQYFFYFSTLEGSNILRSNSESLWQGWMVSEFGRGQGSTISHPSCHSLFELPDRKLTRRLIKPIDLMSILYMYGEM